MKNDNHASKKTECLTALPLTGVLLGAILLGLAPFQPEPHLVEKLRMLVDGTLSKPIDIFDLLLHASMPTLLLIKIYCMLRSR